MPHNETSSVFTTAGLNKRFKGDKGEPGIQGASGNDGANAFGPLTINRVNETATDYTLTVADADLALVLTDNAAANNVTIPPNVDVPIGIGQQIFIAAIGVGQTTLVAGAGVTIRSAGGNLKLTQTFSGMSGVQIALNEWLIFGDLTT